MVERFFGLIKRSESTAHAAGLGTMHVWTSSITLKAFIVENDVMAKIGYISPAEFETGQLDLTEWSTL